ncbi:MAG: trigger factor [Phycisphaerae bacterium]|nr:trigger factor [Phycisphaerae bacterium]
MVEKKEEAEIKNVVKIEESGPCKKKISVEVPEEKITKITDEQYETLRKDAQVPGFRKGRAPRRLLEKRFGKEVAEQIKLQIIAEASEQAVKDNELDVLGDPNIDHEKIELPESGPLKFEFEAEVRPQFELPELEGIEVEKTKLEVEDDQIDREVEQLAKYSGMWSPREDGGAEESDQVTADVLLKIEGIEEEEKLDNTEIYVRKNGFVGAIPVEDLEKILAGVKGGDKKETTVKVGETYYKEEYRGKKVEIKIAVKEVKWLKPAQINEDFLKRFGVETEDQLRDNIRENLESRLEQQSRAQMTEQIYEYLLEKIDFELPTSVVADQSNTILQRQFSSLLNRGMKEDELKAEIEKLRATSEKDAKEQLKQFFIMDKVAAKYEIEVSDEEVNGRIAQIAIQQGQRPEQMREQMARNGSLSQFAGQIREEKAIAKILEKAKIKEVEPKKEAKKAKKAVKKTAKKTANKTAKAEKKPAAKKKTVKKAKKTTKKKTDE